MKKISALTLGLAFAFLSSSALAATIEVKMVNKGTDGHSMSFEPAIVKANPGDTIKFVAVDRFHSIESIEEMLPSGAETFAGELSKDFEVTLDKPGVYGITCTPHMTMGMVGLIVVGTPTNVAAVKAANVLEGKAKERMDALLATVN